MSKTRSKKDEVSSEKQLSTTDPILRDLQERYNMDEEIWQKSKRGFPFNIPLKVIVAIALGGPIIASLYAFDYSNQYLWKVYIFTLVISIPAYYVSEKAIGQFKESLEKNGLFGKDLNKAGLRDTKPPV